ETTEGLLGFIRCEMDMLDTSEEPIHLLLSQLTMRGSAVMRRFLRTISMKAFE
ncbi:uncharacterized, partial [Tachysurus ichikawai]